VLDRQPDNAPARTALAEALLSQSSFHEAAEVARQVPVDGGCAAPSARAECFAALVAGSDRDVVGALERAAATDLPRAELELLAAWRTARNGDELPARLPAQAAPLLEVTLEALLRVQEVDAFGQLVPLVERVGLTWREQRELLASMYLRRGFLESAGDEWIRVCREREPDAAALVGLSQVALARELPEDALVFAREAQALDPGHQGAARLVAGLSGT
jgi:hypothetical protein